MNAENYVKAFQGIMGVYGLQFLLVPKKIVRFFKRFYSTSSFIVDCLFQIRSIIPVLFSKGNWVDKVDKTDITHLSLS
jgi:hypothetical protein